MSVVFELQPMKEAGHETSATLDCHIIEIGWFISFVELPYDHGRLKSSQDWQSSAAYSFHWLYSKLTGSQFS